jgi:hypothetical protein
MPQPIAQLQNIIQQTEQTPPGHDRDKAILHLLQADRALRVVFDYQGIHCCCHGVKHS